MKDLRTLLEASLLGDIEDSMAYGDKLANMDFETLMSATSMEQFNMYAKYMKQQIEDSANGPFSEKQLKKGKAYIYIWEDSWFDDSIIVGFVDKWPITDKNLLNDGYYIIEWDDSRRFNRASCRFDNTGNEFSGLLQYDFDGDNTMKDAYEIPSKLIPSMKNVIKLAKPYV